MPTDVELKLMRERRADIIKQLGELRSVLRDLESHRFPPTATAEERNDYHQAMQTARDRIHALDLEYVGLS